MLVNSKFAVTGTTRSCDLSYWIRFIKKKKKKNGFEKLADQDILQYCKVSSMSGILSTTASQKRVMKQKVNARIMKLYIKTCYLNYTSAYYHWAIKNLEKE